MKAIPKAIISERNVPRSSSLHKNKKSSPHRIVHTALGTYQPDTNDSGDNTAVGRLIRLNENETFLSQKNEDGFFPSAGQGKTSVAIDIIVK